jgi:hypothetical protein
MTNKLLLIRKTVRLSCIWVATGDAQRPLACIWVREKTAQAAHTTPSANDAQGVHLCA